MSRTLLFVIAWNLVMVSAVSADIPLPMDLKYIDPRVRFEGIEKHPDHVFYLRFLTFTGGPGGIPHRLVAVKDSKAFNLNAQRRLIDMNLLAMERKEFDKKAKADPSLKWLTNKTEGVLVASVATPSTTASVKVKEAPVTTYKVSLEDGKLTAMRVEETRGPAPLGVLPIWAFGLVSAVSLSWLGIWFARRGGKTTNP